MTFGKLIRQIRHSEKKKAEVIRYGITGALATLLQYVIYLMGLNLLGLSPTVSTIVSYGLSFIANFFLSNIFTFRTSPNKVKAVAFTLSHFINLGLQTILVSIFSKIIAPNYALLPAMALCIPCNFLLVRFALKSHRFQSR